MTKESQLFFNLLVTDLEEINSKLSASATRLEHSKVLVLGGTGFVGTWLVGTLGYLKSIGHDIDITIASRKQQSDYPHFQQCEFDVSWLQVDIAEAATVDFSQYTHLVNAATPSTAGRGNLDAMYLYKTVVNGTESLLESLRKSKQTRRLVNLSSGAARVLEESEPDTDYKICPRSHLVEPSRSYAHAKKISEQLVDSATQDQQILGVNLRLYAFIGPHLPLNEHFAAGNFILNALNSVPVAITGNPETTRAYMYPVDLTVHILNMLSSSTVGTYEVGGSKCISIGELASTISKSTSNVPISIGKTTTEKSNYYAKNPIVTTSEIQLSDGISRWWRWLAFQKL